MFQGSIPALITPFKNGEVDRKAFADLVERQIENGAGGLVPCGTTGESATLSHEEHREVVSLCIEVTAGRIPVIAGAGSNSTREAIGLVQHAKDAGADAALCVCPYYNRPDQAGLEAHFRAIADTVALPIILYNVPGRTSTNINADTVVRLSRIPNIVGIKEASSDPTQIAQIIRDSQDDFNVWSGNDDETFPIMCVGGYGVVSVASNLYGNQIKTMMGLILEGNIESAASEHKRLLPIFKALFWVTNPIPVKYAVNRAGFRAGKNRLPLCDADEDFRSKFDGIMDQYEVDLPVN